MPGIPPSRYAYLGPEGTFTETALRALPAAARADLLPFSSVPLALDAVRAGDVDGAMVPIENSIEGGVTATVDALATGEPLVVVRESLVPISFVLAGRAGTTLDDVKRISTHPHAQAQCRGWLDGHLPDAAYVPALSTAAAAAGLSVSGDVGYDAALCAPIAANRYRLRVLADDVADNPFAVTRFVLVARPGVPPAPTGADKTSIVAFQPDDHPGGLLELLEQFAVRGVNLVRIESRPTGDAMGRYCFAIDAEGHVAEARMAEALVGLHRFCSQVRFLGSYPSAEAPPTTVRPGTSDAAFADGRAWVDRLREGRI
ncbi:MAG TPA: prephenate dehydratase [Actinomycetales bacterium]|nr:prephenate dehydratase [Actinomycetales bacterium]